VTLVDGWRDDVEKLSKLAKLINDHLDKKRRPPIVQSRPPLETPLHPRV
jgi:hypothetical protein